MTEQKPDNYLRRAVSLALILAAVVCLAAAIDDKTLGPLIPAALFALLALAPGLWS